MLKTLVILGAAAIAALGAVAAPAATFNFSFTAPVMQWGTPGDTYLGSGQLFADDLGAGLFDVTGASGSSTIQGWEQYVYNIDGGAGQLTLGAGGYTADGLMLFGDGFYGFSLNPGGSSYAIQLGEVGAPEGTLTITPAIAAVPEPTTWAMMIGGFGLAGATLRRRKPTVRFA